MTIGVVIPCFHQESWLEPTLAALERALAGRGWAGALVLSDSTHGALPALGERWRVIGMASPRGTTPGASRMIGFEAVGGDWVLFVDADVEVERDWLDRAVEVAGRDESLVGIGGRLEEWMSDGRRRWLGSTDLVRVGAVERPVEYVTTPAFYRRSALAAVGGYDRRLSSEEDFELGMRLRVAGYRLLSLGVLAGRHWSGPRPSLSEVKRRWSSGLCFGMGQVLRLYLGRPGFGRLLLRQWLYVATLAMWVAALGGLLVGWARRDPGPALAGLAMPPLVWALMTLRKKSPGLGLHALITWTVNGAGMLVGFFRVSSSVEAPVGLGEVR